MSRQNEEDVKYNITLNTPPPGGRGRNRLISSPGAISAFVNGGMTISDAWVKANGARLTSPMQLSPGTPFEVHVSFQANNNSGGVIQAWAVCVTVIDSQRVIYNYNIQNSATNWPGSITNSDFNLNKLSPMIMPDRDITLKIQGWGTDTYNPEPPERSLW